MTIYRFVCNRFSISKLKMRAVQDPKASVSLRLINKRVYFTLFLVLVLYISSHLVISQSPIKFLPGFEGPLPFEFETGYVGVDESEVELFYYFVKSEGSPKEDPVILWLTGGPGCSSFSGFIYEIGPLYFRAVKYNGSLPTLVLNPNSWTKRASIIFLDWPVGTGFSYATTPRASQSYDLQQCDLAYQFLKKWLIGHPEFISNPFYVGGDSYSGITVPIITQMISDGNEVHTNQYINLQGYLVGNPVTNSSEEDNYAIPFAHGMALISDELYHSLLRSCGGKYLNINPNNVECLTNVHAFEKCRSKINPTHILEPYYERDSGNPDKLVGEKRDLLQKYVNHDYDPLSSSSSSFSSRVDGYWLSYHWMNDKSVQVALHIRNGSIKKWARCDYDLPYTITILDSRAYHLNLSKKGYRSLVYSGDHDMIVPYMSTQAWIKKLNYSIVDDWRSWCVNGQVAGYTRTYSNKMTFATIKGGGHTAPEYKPRECYAMFFRWIWNEPL